MSYVLDYHAVVVTPSIKSKMIVDSWAKVKAAVLINSIVKITWLVFVKSNKLLHSFEVWWANYFSCPTVDSLFCILERYDVLIYLYLLRQVNNYSLPLFAIATNSMVIQSCSVICYSKFEFTFGLLVNNMKSWSDLKCLHGCYKFPMLWSTGLYILYKSLAASMFTKKIIQRKNRAWSFDDVAVYSLIFAIFYFNLHLT